VVAVLQEGVEGSRVSGEWSEKRQSLSESTEGQSTEREFRCV